MLNTVQWVVVTEDEQGQRLDNFLATRLKGLPKSALYRLIRKGEVRVNKGRAKPDRRLSAGETVRIPPVRMQDKAQPPKPSEQLATTLDAAVLFEQDGLVVVNKPAGIAVHGGSGIHLGLVEALRQLERFKGFLELVHRLDRETSGCIMLARKRSVLKHLQTLLRDRAGVEKTYIALVQGEWPANRDCVDVPLQRITLPHGERLVKVHRDGKPAVTQFRVLAKGKSVTLVEAKPITGRTHQIRVHAKHVGCPLVGDDKYGDTPFNTELKRRGVNRLFLHAAKLSVEMSDECLHFEAPLPPDLQNTLAMLAVQLPNSELGLL